MNSVTPWFAMLGGRGLTTAIRSWIRSNSGFSEQTVISVAVLLVIFSVFAWAALLRKRGHSARQHQHHPPRNRPPETAPRQPVKDGKGGGFFWRLRHKRRRRRREERPRNPTLAETGGLPAPRDKESESHAAEDI